MKKSKQLAILSICILCIIVGIAFYITPVSYFVMLPGEALDTSEYVKVQAEQPMEKGQFLLTTISLRRANVADYVLSYTSDEVKLLPESDILAKDESDEQYEQRQKENMMESQTHAIIAAFQQAKKPIEIKRLGVEVIGLVEESKSKLQKGDLIEEVDGQVIGKQEDLANLLEKKKAGETVQVRVIRSNKPINEQVTLVPLKGTNRIGLGIIPMDRVKVVTQPPVEIHADEIGGPSAGLMFSLELLDQLLPENLTRGYTIAGTGTIDMNGRVGQIGGIDFKVRAADEKGATIFFCPRDQSPKDQNEKIAKETVKQIGSNMRVVPVSSLDEAVKYLLKLPMNDTAVNDNTLTGLG